MAKPTTDARELSEAVRAQAKQLDAALTRGHGASATEATLNNVLIYSRGGRLGHRGAGGLGVPTTETVLTVLGTRPLKPGDDPVAASITAIITALSP